MNNTNTVMTLKQARAARALASAYGHSWASVEETEGLLCPEEIKAACEAACTCSCSRVWSYEKYHDAGCPASGWSRPILDGSNVIHTTCTGRLSWVVDARASTIEINRPGIGSVLTLVIEHGSENARITWQLSEEIFDRHIEAAAEALAALGVGPEALAGVFVGGEFNLSEYT